MPTVSKFNKTYLEKFVLPLQGGMAKGSQQIFWDPRFPGFGLKLTPTMAVFVIQHRLPTGKTARVVIGNYRQMTIEDAEKAARLKLSEMKGGIHPVETKKAAEVAGTTLQETLDTYLEKRASRLRPKTVEVYRSAVRRCFADWLSLPIAEINEDMVSERHTALSNANGPRGKGEAQADQAMRVLRTLFNYAMLTLRDKRQKRIITENPVLRLKAERLWNKAVSRDDIIADDDLAAWHEAVMKLENETVRDYMLLCLFTGLRRTEAARLKWSAVRLTGKKPMLTIPAADTKTNTEHKLPLSSFLVPLLEGRSSNKIRRIDNDYVFPGEKPGTHIVEPKRAIARVVSECGIPFSMHTLRRTFGTVAGRLDIAHYKHKMLLNHSLKAEVTGAHYVKLTVDDLREPMQKITDYLKAACKAASDGQSPEGGVSNL
jgi:integrase